MPDDDDDCLIVNGECTTTIMTMNNAVWWECLVTIKFTPISAVGLVPSLVLTCSFWFDKRLGGGGGRALQPSCLSSPPSAVNWCLNSENDITIVWSLQSNAARTLHLLHHLQSAHKHAHTHTHTAATTTQHDDDDQPADQLLTSASDLHCGDQPKVLHSLRASSLTFNH